MNFATTISCKICQSPAPLHGVVDRNKSCETARGRFFPLLGEPVWYHRCQACGFLFTPDFDGWTIEDWRREVYNDDYARVDPDGADGSRARANAPLAIRMAREMNASTILDYGGGDGTMAREVQSAGRQVWCYDPIHQPVVNFGLAFFDLITAFEVIEHAAAAIETAREIISFMYPGGAFLFSTLTCDDLAPQDTSWWYLAPRNGHVSIHTTRSLDIMFGALGCEVRHLTAGLHIAARLPQPRT